MATPLFFALYLYTLQDFLLHLLVGLQLFEQLLQHGTLIDCPYADIILAPKLLLPCFNEIVLNARVQSVSFK